MKRRSVTAGIAMAVVCGALTTGCTNWKQKAEDAAVRAEDAARRSEAAAARVEAAARRTEAAADRAEALFEKSLRK